MPTPTCLGLKGYVVVVVDDLGERDIREDGCLKSSIFQQDHFFLYCEVSIEY